jgi:DNA-nicking Smr family endonuclease
MVELEGLSAEEVLKAKAEPPTKPPSRHVARLGKRLSRGEREPEAVLDLHGLDRRAAIAELDRFLREQRRAGATILLVVHGKGTEVLARAVGERLESHPAVAEHLRAPARLGGGGARVVRLESSTG